MWQIYPKLKKCPAVTFYQQIWILITNLKSRPVFRIQVPKVRLLDCLGPAPPDCLVEPGKEQSADEGWCQLRGAAERLICSNQWKVSGSHPVFIKTAELSQNSAVMMVSWVPLCLCLVRQTWVRIFALWGNSLFHHIRSSIIHNLESEAK